MVEEDRAAVPGAEAEVARVDVEDRVEKEDAGATEEAEARAPAAAQEPRDRRSSSAKQ